MFIDVYFCFQVIRRSFQLLSNILRTGRTLIFPDFLSFFSLTSIQSPQPAFLKLTFLYSQWIRNLNALAYLPEKCYLCTGNGRKGPNSRMSDECLMKQETVFSYCNDCQAVMRKFTLAGKTNYFLIIYLFWQAVSNCELSFHLCCQKPLFFTEGYPSRYL